MAAMIVPEIIPELVPENLTQKLSPNVLNENTDIAGSWVSHPNYFHIRARITTLVDRYLSSAQLNHHLAHFTAPVEHSYSCPWQATPLNLSNQVIGIDRELFVQVLTNLVQVDPISAECISAYLQEWMQSLPQTVSLPPIAPAIQTALINNLHLHYPSQDLPQQLFHRVTHTWSAVSIYFWLMAHSTSDLQQAIVHLLQSEIHQLARLWSLSRWALGEGFVVQLQYSQQDFTTPFDHPHSLELGANHQADSLPLIKRLPMTIEITFACLQVMARLRDWNDQLHPIVLRGLFEPEFFPYQFEDNPLRE